MKQNQLIVLALLLLCACDPKVDTGGYVKDGNIKEQIIVGQTTRDQVREKLGSPSSISSFGDESWYYITDRKETVAFFKPEVVEQQIVRIDFDKSGVVSKVENYNQNDRQDFAIVKRSTPTEGHTLGFMEQILGNIGRFNHPDSGGTSLPGRPGGH